MNGVRQGWLVAKRELRERSRSRAFLASLAISGGRIFLLSDGTLFAIGGTAK